MQKHMHMHVSAWRVLKNMHMHVWTEPEKHTIFVAGNQEIKNDYT
jgi:hypothetical protein